jgi:hypothetical protein
VQFVSSARLSPSPIEAAIFRASMYVLCSCCSIPRKVAWVDAARIKKVVGICYAHAGGCNHVPCASDNYNPLKVASKPPLTQLSGTKIAGR